MGDSIKHVPPHICYLAGFGRSRSNRLGVGRDPKTLEML